MDNAPQGFVVCGHSEYGMDNGIQSDFGKRSCIIVSSFRWRFSDDSSHSSCTKSLILFESVNPQIIE